MSLAVSEVMVYRLSVILYGTVCNKVQTRAVQAHKPTRPFPVDAAASARKVLQLQSH